MTAKIEIQCVAYKEYITEEAKQDKLIQSSVFKFESLNQQQLKKPYFGLLLRWRINRCLLWFFKYRFLRASLSPLS